MKGHIRKRGQNSWEVCVYLGRKDEGGKYQRVSRTVHGTKRDAESGLAELIVQSHTGQVSTTKDTTGEYLLRWLEDYVKPNLAPLTAKSYEMIIQNHINPAIGDIPLKRLQPVHIQDYYTKMRKSGRNDGKGGLSNRTVLYHHRVLHEALKHAVRLELVHRNVTDAVIPPKMQAYEAATYSSEEVLKLLDTAKNTRLYMPILLAVSTGMRRGEVFGLRWKDLDAGKARIMQTVLQPVAKGAGLQIKAPKTKKSRWTITLPGSLLPELKKHKVMQNAEKLALGKAYQNNDLVVCREDGSPVNPDTFSQTFAKFLADNGLPHVRFHDLRHTHATLLVENGADFKTVSDRLGHSAVGITLDTYSHATPRMKDKAAEIMDEILQRARR